MNKASDTYCDLLWERLMKVLLGKVDVLHSTLGSCLSKPVETLI